MRNDSDVEGSTDGSSTPSSSTDAEFENAWKASDCGAWDSPPFLGRAFWGVSPPGGGPRSWLREPFCALSHLLGALASVIACLVLLRLAAGQSASIILGVVLYSVSLIFLYMASGMYHSWRGAPHTIALLQRLDHSAIFLLIAGTFAPVCLITLRGVLGWSLLAGEYILALVGVGLVIYRLPFPAHWRVGMYLVMGWLPVLFLEPLHASLATAGVAWLISGGLLYSLGTAVLATDRPHLWSGRFGPHDLWHLFVLGGSICHFILIYRIIGG